MLPGAAPSVVSIAGAILWGFEPSDLAERDHVLVGFQSQARFFGALSLHPEDRLAVVVGFNRRRDSLGL